MLWLTVTQKCCDNDISCVQVISLLKQEENDEDICIYIYIFVI